MPSRCRFNSRGASCQPVKSPASCTECASGARREKVTFCLGIFCADIDSFLKRVNCWFDTAPDPRPGQASVIHILLTTREKAGDDVRTCLNNGARASARFNATGEGKLGIFLRRYFRSDIEAA